MATSVVVSTRVSPELKERLDRYLAGTGKTLAGLLAEVVDGRRQADTSHAYNKGIIDGQIELARMFVRDPDQFLTLFGAMVLVAVEEQERRGNE